MLSLRFHAGQPVLVNPGIAAATPAEALPMKNPSRVSFRLVASLVVLALPAAYPILTGAAALDPPLEEQANLQKESAATQKRIDSLDDQAQTALAEYKESLRRADQLATYNAQMERMITSQHDEMTDLGEQIRQIEITKREIFPLMRQMLDVLAQLVDTDVPFLLEERRTRLDELNGLMQQAGASLAEKYRRLLEAYQIEMEYGNTIEAYRGELPKAAEAKTVEFLRIGRTALYYMTLDESEAGVWDKNSQSWQVLPGSDVELVRQGLRLARKELPPDLIRLPVFTAEGTT